MNGAFVALAAGAVAFLFAWAGAGPPGRSGLHARPNVVTAVVRNDLGQLKWVSTRPVPDTKLEAAGKRVYAREHCGYCHSQYVRPMMAQARPWGPISADPRRWGPPSEPAEYVLDNPALLGPGGIGPDLSREGLKYSDEWHLAHFWDPRMVTQHSVMEGFSHLFATSTAKVRIVHGAGSVRTLEQTAETRRFFDFASKEQFKLTPNEQGLLFVPSIAQGKYPLIWTPNNEYGGATVRLAAETPDLEALIAYVQKLGLNRGRWREAFEPDVIEGSKISLPKSDEWIGYGKQVYERRCIACHGAKGDGNGPAATFLYRQRPRNFTLGEFKFRLTKGPLPSDADLLRTITRGVRGTAMPAWFELPLDDRLAVIQYIKYVLTADRSDPAKPDFYFEDEPPGAKLDIGQAPVPSAALVAHGGTVWLQAKCWECHGRTGKGDGEKAAGLKDDWGFPVRPANLTSGRFKSGPAVADLYRTISTGLSGTPMPSFHDAFSDADRWALATYILSL
jgi:cytochrome c oxidase cbb3-type subunit I/II